MKKSNLVNGLAAIVAMGLIGVAANAADEESGLKGRSVKVSFEDLNLEKEQGARVLYRHLRHASKKVCGVGTRNAISVRISLDALRCYRSTLTAEVKKIDNRLLTKIHES